MYPGLKDSMMKSAVFANLSKYLLPFKGFDIESDASLIRIAGKEKETFLFVRQVMIKRGNIPSWVASGRFDFDDIGA